MAAAGTLGTQPQDSALTPYSRAVRNHVALVALVVLATLGGTLAWISVRKPHFESTAGVLVTPLPQSGDALLGLPLIRDTGDPTRTVQTAAALLASPAASEEAARRLGPGWTRGAVDSRIQVQPKGESSIIDITATAGSRALARDLANTYALAALDARRALLRRRVGFALAQVRAQRQAVAQSDSQLSVDLAARENQLVALRNGDDPTLGISALAGGAQRTDKSATLLGILGIIGGLALGLGAALVLELLERRVRDEDDLRRLVPAPILARVPTLPRRQLSGGVQAPPTVREAYRTVQIQLDQMASGGRTVMVTSATRGDGKTTSAVNLAAALVGGGARVVLVDFDLRKPEVASRLGIEPAQDLVSLLAGRLSLDDILVPAPELPALRVAPANPGGTDALLLEALSRRLPALLEEARALADYVVVDTPPMGEVGDALRVAPHVDEIVIVVRPGNTDRTSLTTVTELIARAGRTPAGLIVIGASSEDAYGYGYGHENGGSRRPLLRALGRR